LGKGKSDEVDVQDLMNVMMDVSLEIFGKEEIGKITESFSGGPLTRYSAEKPVITK
jgi:hypothetical protein